MVNLKSRKGEIATLLTLGLVLVGGIVTLGISLLSNRQNNIAMNPKATGPNCSSSQCTGSTKCYNVGDSLGGSTCCASGTNSNPNYAKLSYATWGSSCSGPVSASPAVSPAASPAVSPVISTSPAASFTCTTGTPKSGLSSLSCDPGICGAGMYAGNQAINGNTRYCCCKSPAASPSVSPAASPAVTGDIDPSTGQPLPNGEINRCCFLFASSSACGNGKRLVYWGDKMQCTASPGLGTVISAGHCESLGGASLKQPGDALCMSDQDQTQPATDQKGYGSGGIYGPSSGDGFDLASCPDPQLPFNCCVVDNYCPGGTTRYRWYGCTGQPCSNTKLSGKGLPACPSGVNQSNQLVCGAPAGASPAVSGPPQVSPAVPGASPAVSNACTQAGGVGCMPSYDPSCGNPVASTVANQYCQTANNDVSFACCGGTALSPIPGVSVSPVVTQPVVSTSPAPVVTTGPSDTSGFGSAVCQEEICTIGRGTYASKAFTGHGTYYYKHCGDTTGYPDRASVESDPNVCRITTTPGATGNSVQLQCGASFDATSLINGTSSTNPCTEADKPRLYLIGSTGYCCNNNSN